MESRTPRKYSDTFRYKVVQEVLEGKYTQEEARGIYGIRSKSAILEWMRKFSGHPRRKNSPIKPISEMKKTIREKELEARIKELEEELYIEKHRACLHEKIVEVAEERYGLELRKKYGARQYEEPKKKQG